MEKMIKTKGKQGQEEIVGFALIVIIVSIIIIFFLVFSLSEQPETASYEAESFLAATLVYTSSCIDIDNGEFFPVQELVSSCYNTETCGNGEDSCEVLNETLNALLEESWPIGSDFPAKGYKMEIFTQQEQILLIEKGNATGTYKGAQQPLPYAGAQIQVLFNVYS